MGGSLSAAGATLLHARPGVHGPELPSSSASSSRPPSGAGGGLGDPWLNGDGGGSHPGSSSPSTPPRWSTPERRAAAKGAAAGAAGGALALAALLLLVAGRGNGATAPPASSAHPARRLADGGPGSEGLGLWGGAAEGRGGAAAGGPPAAARLPGQLPAAAADPRPSSSPPPAPRPPVLISYAYFEKDATQAANLAFFIAAGLGQGGAAGVAGGGREEARGGGQARRADTILTVSGPACTPCAGLARGLARLPLPPSLSAALITSAWGRTGLTLLHRAANEGMDFGAHNASLAWAAADASGGRRAAAPPPSAAPPPALALAAAARFGYAFFIFLNSSVRGPFVPAYLPAGWHWSRAFTDGLARDGCAGGQEEGGEDAPPPSTSSSCLPPAEAPPPSAAAALVAASLTCLPPEDAGGPGPRAESWAFALSAGGLATAEGAGVFAVRACKLCADPAAGIVVGGEYGLSSTLLAAGARLATLQARYARGTDWADPAHWGCNACAHPSRHGTYGPGLALHPFETMFVKASWGVGAPFLEAYTAWATGHARGDDPGTGAVRVEETGGSGGGGAEGEGSGGPTSPWARGPAAACDLPLYRYGVSPAATAPAATAGLAASFLPPGLAGLVGSDGGGGGADR